MNDSLSRRQAGLWCFCALSVPAVLTCARLGWSWVLLAGAAAAGYFALSRAIEKRAGEEDLCALTLLAYGEAGKAVLALGGAFSLLAAAQSAARAGAAFHDQTKALAGAAALLLAALANRKGAARAGRVCGVLGLILGALYGVILWTAGGEVKLRWLSPWGSWKQSFAAGLPLLAGGCVRFLPRRKEKAGWGWLALLAVGPAMIAAVTAGCLSPGLSRTLVQPFDVLMQSLNVLGVIERFEPLGSAALWMGFFALVSLLLASAQAQLRAAGLKAAKKEWASGALAAMAFLLGFWTEQVPAQVWALGAAIFWGIGPILTQLIVGIKKD